MSYQSRGLQISFTVHVLFYLAIALLSCSLATKQKIIKIDFSLEEQRSEGVASQRKMVAETREKEVEGHKPEVIEEKRENISQEQEITPQPQSIVPVHEITAKTKRPQRPHLKEKPEAPKVTGERPAPPTPAPALAAKGAEAKDVKTEKDRSHETTRNAAEGAATGSSAASREEATAIYLKKHFSYIRELIQKSLMYPRIARARGWAGKVTVSFVVFENGKVEDVKVNESSGFAILDKNALDTIKKASPFPRPPVRAELIMPIVYRLE
jgi:protein TonB